MFSMKPTAIRTTRSPIVNTCLPKTNSASHYSKSKLGHSYSVWLPWDETGGPQKEISLIARFTPEKGGVVVGEQTKQMLPGKTQIIAKNPADGALPTSAPQAIPAQNSFTTELRAYRRLPMSRRCRR